MNYQQNRSSFSLSPEMLYDVEESLALPGIRNTAAADSRTCSDILSEIVDFMPADLPVVENEGDFRSTDTLQSLVQSCVCGNHLGKTSHNDDTIQCEHHPTKQDHKLVSKKSKDGNDDKETVACPCDDSVLEKTKKAKKERISWTDDLHEKFVECVNRLGGKRKATPKGILKLMNCEKLTIFQVKSHLQKYRTTQLKPEKLAEPDSSLDCSHLDSQTGVKIVEALRLQLQVQRSLYEQLEEQKKLQFRIEEQTKQLHTLQTIRSKTTDDTYCNDSACVSQID